MIGNADDNIVYIEVFRFLFCNWPDVRILSARMT